MINDDRIDILLALYNNENYLRAQLESIFNQTHQNFHVMARDDCSQDTSREIYEEFLDKYPDKITLIKGAINLGASGNFAALLAYKNKNSQAAYTMFSDGDDVWLPQKIEKSLLRMKQTELEHGSEIPILVHSDLRVVHEDLTPISPSFWNYSRLNPKRTSVLNRLLIHNVVTGCTMLINKPLAFLAEPIPCQVIMHDWWIALVAVAFGKIEAISEASMLYRQHGKNEVGAKDWRAFKTYQSYLGKLACRLERKKLSEKLFKTVQQAALFLECYGSKLSEPSKSIVKDYVSLAQANAFKKRYLLIKRGFFKNSLAKNVAVFLII